MGISGLLRAVGADRRRIAVAAVGAAWISTLALGGSGARLSKGVWELGLVVAPLLAAVACWRASRRVGGRLRSFWLLIGASVFSWSLGRIAWTWYEALQGRQLPTSLLAVVGYLCAVPLAVAAMLVLPSGRQSLSARIRTLIDGCMIAGAALLSSWVFVLQTVFRHETDRVTDTVGILYPLGDVIVVTVVLYVLLRLRRSGGRRVAPVGLVGAGLLVIAFADSAFTSLASTGAYRSESGVDVGWFVGFLLVLLAALAPAPAADAEQPAPESATLLLPYVAVVAALASSSFELVRTGRSTPFVSWVRTAIVLALIVRQVLTLHENRSLTERLEERLRDLHVSEQRFEALVQHSSDVVTVVSPDGTVTYQSESIAPVLGYSADSVAGTSLADLLESASAARFTAALAEVADREQGVRVLELDLRHADGRLCHVEMTLTNLLANPSVGGIVLNTRDVSEQKALQDQLRHEASHDSLTTLANRGLFRDRVEKELRGADSRPATLTILFLDLDGFKEVNDTLGHAVGDTLLIQVAERLRSCVRPSDTVARLGGDEFAVLIADRSSERDGAIVADRITKAMREPFVVEGREIDVGASIGIAATDEHVEDADDLLRNADLAMYRAKASGAGRFERYEPKLHVARAERIKLEAELREAIAGGELELHYQPMLSLATGEIVGVEALARWKHPVRGYVPPGEFVQLAEETGLIRRLGCWGLTEACRQLARWDELLPGRSGLTMSVNISGRHLEEAALVDDVREALAESGVAARRLLLELTESLLMAHTDENVELLARLKELGVRLAIDDFGTGYSSLAYLHRFPADVIKIDRSFVEQLGGSDADGALLRTIVQLGRSLRMVTVAEGVETAEQAESLRGMGCELAQGYHFERAVPAGQLERLLARDGRTQDRPRPRAAA